MSEISASEMLKMAEILGEHGIRTAQQLARVLDDDGRASTFWHDGYSQGFRYAHTMQATMQTCERTLQKVQDFQREIYDANKLLKEARKLLRTLK